MNERELLKRLVEASNEAYSFEQLGELCDPIAEDAKDLLAQPERKPPCRPECLSFALEFLGEPESGEVMHYIEQLERFANVSRT